MLEKKSDDDCWFIDERCSNISEYSIKDSNKKYKIECKHSENERTSSCEKDSCKIYSLKKKLGRKKQHQQYLVM
jgi:hypothetical protein